MGAAKDGEQPCRSGVAGQVDKTRSLGLAPRRIDVPGDERRGLVARPSHSRLEPDGKSALTVRTRRFARALTIAAAALLLGGCESVMNPAGDVALRERNLILASTGLMLLIIVPVIAATLIFAWRYRASNTAAVYDPEWHHSTQLEVLIWTAPLLIIVALGALTWISTHVLDPFHTVTRLSDKQPVPAATKPLVIDAVALDWKWLFIYPEQGIATVNDLSLPINRPVDFHITSATVMNAFFIPALAGQIYAMAGMETKLSVVANRTGDFNGLSSPYSGSGFSHMNFGTHSLDEQGFYRWVAATKAKGTNLDAATFKQLEKPSEGVAPIYYSGVRDRLYDDILNMCSTPGKMCVNEMMTIDAHGGGGKNSEENYKRLLDDSSGVREGDEAPGATFPASGRPPNTIDVQPQGMKPREVAPKINAGGVPGSSPSGNMPGMGDHDMKGHDMSGDGTPGHDTSGHPTAPTPGNQPAPAQLNEH